MKRTLTWIGFAIVLAGSARAATPDIWTAASNGDLRAITQQLDKGANVNAGAAEEGANRWFAYPRWTKDEAAIVYHASPSLYLYTLKDGATRKVSTNDRADYRYPHTEATPK